MKQQCPMGFIYFSWLIYIGGIAFLILTQGLLLMILWLLWFPLVMGLYIKYFSRVSRYLGYGSVEDEPGEPTNTKVKQVTLYTALGCPFCPLVERRLQDLQKEMNFALEQVDITFKPGLLMRKRIQAVPVVEIGDRTIVGHTTTRQLRELISSS